MPTSLNNTASELTTAPAGSPPGSSERLVRSAGVVSLAVLMSRMTGLLRESVMARLFGAGLIYDAFHAGLPHPEPDARPVRRRRFIQRLCSHFHRIPHHAQQRRSGSPGKPGRDGADSDRGSAVRAGHDLRARPGASAGSRIRRGPGKIRAGRNDDAHHVPVSADGGAGGAGDGRAERLERFRRSGYGVDLFQHRLGGFRNRPRDLARAVGASIAHRGHGGRRGAGRSSPVVLAVAQPALPWAIASGPFSIGPIPA